MRRSWLVSSASARRSAPLRCRVLHAAGGGLGYSRGFCLALAPRIHAGSSAHGRRGAAYCCELSVARSPSGLADHPLLSSVCACAVPGAPEQSCAGEEADGEGAERARGPRGGRGCRTLAAIVKASGSAEDSRVNTLAGGPVVCCVLHPPPAPPSCHGVTRSWPHGPATATRTHGVRAMPGRPAGRESAFERTCLHHPAASGRAAGRPCRKTPPQRPRGCRQGQRAVRPRPALRVVWERCGIGSLRACAEHEAFTRPAHPQTGRCAARIRLPVEPTLHRVPTVNEDHRSAPAGRADVLPCPSRASRLGCRSGTRRPVARLAAARTAPHSQHSRAQSGGNFQAGTSGTWGTC